MLGRVADNIYWLSRYIERASNTARFIEASYYLNLDIKINDKEQWSPLVEINDDMDHFLKFYDEPSRENVIHYLIYNPVYPNSITSCLNSACTIARGLRESLSIELFQEINEISKIVTPTSKMNTNASMHVFEICERIKKSDMLITGIMSKNVERNLGYRFWRLGEYLERADKTSRLLNVKYYYILPEKTDIGTSIEDLQWSAILQSIDARDAFYRRYNVFSPENIIKMIVKDNVFPRSILFCLISAQKCLSEITGNTPSDPNNRLTHLCYKLEHINESEIMDMGLHEFIDQIQFEMNDINNSIYNYFSAMPYKKGLFGNLSDV